MPLSRRQRRRVGPQSRRGAQGKAKGRWKRKGPVRPRTSAVPHRRFFPASRWLTISGGVGEEADDPNRCEVKEMTLIAMTQLDTEALFHTPNERICVTTPEETHRRGPAAAAGHQGPPASRPQSESPSSIPPGSERRCRQACASWRGSSPAPTSGGRHPGRRPLRRRIKGPATEQFANLLSVPSARRLSRVGPG